MISPKPNQQFDPNVFKNPFVSLSECGFTFLPTISSDTQNTSTPLISNIIYMLSECSQTADLQPNIYGQVRNPEQALVSPQRSAALSAVKTLLIKTKPILGNARSIQTYSCITAYD